MEKDVDLPPFLLCIFPGACFFFTFIVSFHNFSSVMYHSFFSFLIGSFSFYHLSFVSLFHILLSSFIYHFFSFIVYCSLVSHRFFIYIVNCFTFVYYFLVSHVIFPFLVYRFFLSRDRSFSLVAGEINDNTKETNGERGKEKGNETQYNDK